MATRRVNKPPEIRRRELMETALRLFLQKGLDETSVSDIVAAVGVAQGTFYYHFESKERVLEAICEEVTLRLVREAQRIAGLANLGVLRRVERVVSLFFQPREVRRRMGGRRGLMHHPQIHDRMVRCAFEALRDVLAGLLEEGVGREEVNVTRPSETAGLLVLLFAELEHRGELVGAGEEDGDLLEAASNVLARVLGVDRGAIRLGAPRGGGES